MVLAMRPLKAEDEQIVGNILDKIFEEEKDGVAYAIADQKGRIVASGKTDNATRYSSIETARLKALRAILLQKNTADIKVAITGIGLVDDINSGGGVLVIANGILYGAIGISGRPKPKTMFPGKPLWDHEIALQAAEILKDRLNLEEDLN